VACHTTQSGDPSCHPPDPGRKVAGCRRDDQALPYGVTIEEGGTISVRIWETEGRVYTLRVTPESQRKLAEDLAARGVRVNRRADAE
jgi:hypothetical protein